MSTIPETDFLQNWMSEDFLGPFSQEDTSTFLFYGGVSTGGWFRDDTPDETGEPWNLAACLHPPFPHEGESTIPAPVAAPSLDTIFLCPDFFQLDRSESDFGETGTTTPEVRPAPSSPAASVAAPTTQRSSQDRSSRPASRRRHAHRSPRANTWTAAEDTACMQAMRAVCAAGHQGKDSRFAAAATVMERDFSVVKSPQGIKNMWNRRLRQEAGFNDRGPRQRSGAEVTSALGGKGKDREGEDEGDGDDGGAVQVVNVVQGPAPRFGVSLMQVHQREMAKKRRQEEAMARAAVEEERRKQAVEEQVVMSVKEGKKRKREETEEEEDGGYAPPAPQRKRARPRILVSSSSSPEVASQPATSQLEADELMARRLQDEELGLRKRTRRG